MKKKSKKIEFARRVEMRAAELIQRRAVGQDYRDFTTRNERDGMFGYVLRNSEIEAWHAGLLLMEWIAAGKPELEEYMAWSWDPTRPVAGQYPKRGA